MISMPENLPGDPVLLKQLFEQMINERASDKGKIVHLEEEGPVEKLDRENAATGHDPECVG